MRLRWPTSRGVESEPGGRVLEIGAGTGYNVVLVRQITGDSGQVVTVDIDPDAVEDTRK